MEQEQSAPQVFLYTHKRFSIAYNGNRVIEVNLTTDLPVKVEVGSTVHFTYSASWTQTDVPFDERFDKYLDETFFEHQIHWFSIFNSFMMVIFLVGLVAMILMRTLRKDFATYTSRDEDDGTEMGDLADDSGWKQVCICTLNICYIYAYTRTHWLLLSHKRANGQIDRWHTYSHTLLNDHGTDMSNLSI